MRKFTNRWKSAVVLTAACVMLVGCGNTDTTTIAKVGDVKITSNQVEKEMGYIKEYVKMQFGEEFESNPEAKKLLEEQKKEVVNYLVETEVLYAESKKQGLEAKPEEVDKELENMKAQVGGEEQFNKALKEREYTLEQFKAEYAKNLSISNLTQKVTKDIKVTDEEIQTYYNENKDNYTQKPGADMAHILVDTEEKAKEIKAKYDSGTPFEDLAKEFGTDGTKEQGGALGFVEYETTSFDKDFLAGAKQLKEGEVSNPVKTQFGWHLIKVMNIQRDAVITPLEDIKDTVKASLENEKKFEAFNNYVEKIKKDYKIEVYEDKLK